VGDEIIAALFAGPKLRGSDNLSAFARRPSADVVAAYRVGAHAKRRRGRSSQKLNPSSSMSPDGRVGAPR
jgi:hypothetical protein